MGESNKQALCFPPLCLYAVPRPGIPPSSPPLPPECKKAKDKPEQPPPPLPSPPPQLPLPPLPCFSSSLIRALANTKGGREAESGVRVPVNVPRLGRGDDEDDRAEVKDEGEDLRRGVGVVVISRTRLHALCH